jgi:hypothetical protein
VDSAYVRLEAKEDIAMIQRGEGYSAVILALVCFCLVIGGCRPTEIDLDHDAVGKWKTKDGLTIAFYKDGVAAAHGSRVQWKPLDDSSVRIEDEKEIGEFVISKRDDGSMVGVLEVAGTEMTSFFGTNMTYTKVAKKSS